MPSPLVIKVNETPTSFIKGGGLKRNYTLVVGTRLGKSKEYKLNRFLHKVRVI